jgi:hypothetical protein
MGATKPPFPEPGSPVFPRRQVDESEGSPFRQVLQIGVFAADQWALGPQGPYANPRQTAAEVARGQVREALLHLLEIGLLDIDEDRLAANDWWPTSRESAEESAERTRQQEVSGDA